MSPFTRRPAVRWLVPVAAAVVLAAGGSTVGVLTAAARGGLPERSPAAGSQDRLTAKTSTSTCPSQKAGIE